LVSAEHKLTNVTLTAGNASMPTTGGTGNETGHAGNGYVKITSV
jgi:hypothetical protein